MSFSPKTGFSNWYLNTENSESRRDGTTTPVTGGRPAGSRPQAVRAAPREPGAGPGRGGGGAAGGRAPQTGQQAVRGRHAGDCPLSLVLLPGRGAAQMPG